MVADDGTGQLAASVVIAIAMVTTVYMDIRYQRIPNWLTFPLMAVGLAWWALDGGVEGLLTGLAGLVTGLGVFGLFALLGAMGTGDVKLMAGVGAMVGFPHIVAVLFLTAIAGGVEALVVVIWRGQARAAFRRFAAKLRPGFLGGKKEAPTQEPILIPYGVAVAAGTLWSLAYL